MSIAVTVDTEALCYEWADGDSYSCIGFEHVYYEALELTKRLAKRGVTSIAPTRSDIGSLALFNKRTDLLSLYEKVNDSATWFDGRTPSKVKTAIEQLRVTGHRARIFKGCTLSGLDWMELDFVVGTVARSGGAMKAPIMLSEEQPCGPLISTHNVVKIIDLVTKDVLYCHKSFHQPELMIQSGDHHHSLVGITHLVMSKTEHEWIEIGGCRSLDAANHMIAFLQGKSNIPV